MTARKRPVIQSLDLTQEPNSLDPRDARLVRAPIPNQLSLSADLDRRRLGLILKANEALNDAMTFLLICIGAGLLAAVPTIAVLVAQAPFWASIATSVPVCGGTLVAGLMFLRGRRPG